MKYENFDLEASAYKKDESGVEQFVIKVLDSPAGQQREGEVVTLDPSTRLKVVELERRALDRTGMIAFGEALGQTLFPSNARALFERSRDLVGGVDAGLRIRLRLETYALADLPWEYAYLSRFDSPSSQLGTMGFLALDRRVSLVRYELLGQPRGTLIPVSESQLRMVVLLATPSDYPPLDVDGEAKRIRSALVDTPIMEPQVCQHTTIERLSDALLKPAHIFHFAGHGEFRGEMGASFGSVEGAGAVVLEDEGGKSILFPADKLALILNGSGVRLAVLGACNVGRRDGVNAWTGIVPALSRVGIPAVVGMQFTIGDRSAVTFSRNLYRALMAGQTIDEAVLTGRLAVFNSGGDSERDWGTPVLYLRAQEGVLFPTGGTASPSTTSIPMQVSQQTQSQAARTIQAPAVGTGEALPDRVALRNFMVEEFRSDELEALCADITQMLSDKNLSKQTIDLDVVGGSNKTTQALNLIGYMQRRGWYEVLVAAVRAARPGKI